MTVSERLKQYRRDLHYTQETLAELCGVSRQAVAKWENGDNFPDVDNLMRLAEIFNISLDMLVTGKTSSQSKEAHFSDDVRAQNERLINEGLRQALACDDPTDEIQTFIGYGGRMMACDRIYIFEKYPCGYYVNSYEWCNKGVEPQIDNLQGVPAEDLAPWLDVFKRGDYVYIRDLEAIKDTEPVVYSWLAPQNIRNLIAFPFLEGQAFLGVDNPAMAFVGQAGNLLEFSARFVESMLRRRNLTRQLMIETSRSSKGENTVLHSEFYVNLIASHISVSGCLPGWLGRCQGLHSLEDLYQLLDEHPECRDHILKDGLGEAIKTGERSVIEFVLHSEDGTIHWAKLVTWPFMDPAGNTIQLYGTLVDVSGNHEIIDRYNAFTTRMRGGMHICHLSDPCHLAYASDNLCSLAGYTREEFDAEIGESYDSLVVDEDYAAFKGFVRRLTANPGTVETCEYGLKRKDGSVVRVMDTMESVLDSNGIVYGYANVMDVSGLRGALDAAREKELAQMAELDRQFAIVDALSRDYRNIFLVDLDRGLARIHKLNGYVTRGMDRESIEPLPYAEYCERYIQDRVYAPDQDMMRQAMSVDVVQRELDQNSEYSSIYRVEIDGEVRYCQFDYIPLDAAVLDDDQSYDVIAAFKIIDAVLVQDENGQASNRFRRGLRAL